jgi:putative hydrolase of the HAD superfamily
MQYQAVIFDLYGTLVDLASWDDDQNVLVRMAAALSLPSNDFIRMWQATFTQRMQGVFRRYQDCLNYICQHLGAQVEENQIGQASRIRFEMMKQNTSSIREGAVEVLSSLKSNGYKTGLISDCSIETSLVWDDMPLAPLIDAPVLSCLVGISKPDPEIFRIAVDRLEVTPDRCLYIADGIGEELTTASKLGMRAVMIITSTDRSGDPFREDWDGEIISTLYEVPELLES